MQYRSASGRAVIIGGSLGGLSAGLWLRDAGMDVDIFERAGVVLPDRGTGIVLNPATIRYLTAHNGMDVVDIGSVANWYRHLNQDGTQAHVSRTHYRFSSYSALHRSLMACFGEDRYHWGAECIGFEQHADGIEVSFKSGQTEAADMLVFADGINSIGRQYLQPLAAPQYAGYIAWRGKVEERELSAHTFSSFSDAIAYTVLPDSHALSYPIPNRDGMADVGKRLMNWLWYRNISRNEGLYETVVSHDKGRFRTSVPTDQIPDAYIDALRDEVDSLPPAFSETIRVTQNPFIQVVYDLEVSRMAFGRVCLLGDAAFTARPHAAAGTAKAAEDAYQLGQAMRKANGNIIEALRYWEIGQLTLGKGLVARSRTAGERLQSGRWRTEEPLSFGLYSSGDSVFPL